MTDLKSPEALPRTSRRRLEERIGGVWRPVETSAGANRDAVIQRSGQSLNDWVSPDSPLGHALLRRRAGQRVVVTAPNGEFGVAITDGRWSGRPRSEAGIEAGPPAESIQDAGERRDTSVPDKQLARWLDDGGATAGEPRSP